MLLNQNGVGLIFVCSLDHEFAKLWKFDAAAPCVYQVKLIVVPDQKRQTNGVVALVRCFQRCIAGLHDDVRWLASGRCIIPFEPLVL